MHYGLKCGMKSFGNISVPEISTINPCKILKIITFNDIPCSFNEKLTNIVGKLITVLGKNCIFIMLYQDFLKKKKKHHKTKQKSIITHKEWRSYKS